MEFVRLNYSSMTLEDIEMYNYYYFECDGDKKQIVAKLIEVPDDSC